MARIPALSMEDAPADVRRVVDFVVARFGKPLEPILVTAHSPEVFQAYTRFEGAVAHANRLDRRLEGDRTAPRIPRPPSWTT